MKISLISDVHGNLPALEAVLRHARAMGAAQMVINLGDLTGYGPFPEAVVRWSCAPHVLSVLGDYDLKVLNDQHRKTHWKLVKRKDKRAMFAWTYRKLSKRSRKHLRALRKHRLIEVEGIKILLSHGSPLPAEQHNRRDAPQPHLVELAVKKGASVVLSGHTHQAFSCQEQGIQFINPGTVGRPDDGDPRASYAILEIISGKVTVRHYRIPYPIMETVRAIRREGLPEVFAQVIRRGLNYEDTVAAIEESPRSDVLEPCGIISLLTDFGLEDHFVGVMKGVMADIAPHAAVIDITHQVSPQDILAGARQLAHAVTYFPRGTVHVAVVDPGVGTQRRALAAQIGAHFFVAPDNGLLSLVLEQAWETGQPVKLISLSNPAFWLPDISTSFHGRDIFAPVSAHLANGVPVKILGDEIADPVLINPEAPTATPTGWQALVVLIDRFGNLCTNLPGSTLPEDTSNIIIKVGAETIQGLSQAFGDGSPGTLIALVDSTGHLAIAEVNGNAAQRLNAVVGLSVSVVLN